MAGRRPQLWRVSGPNFGGSAALLWRVSGPNFGGAAAQLWRGGSPYFGGSGAPPLRGPAPFGLVSRGSLDLPLPPLGLGGCSPPPPSTHLLDLCPPSLGC